VSIGRNLLGKFGFIGAMKPKIASLELVLKLVQTSIQETRVGAVTRPWLSQSSSREFHSNELARRELNESMAGLPLAR
jgi:hypothetical protein